MARQIVTQQALNEAAEALVAEGVEPSIVAVQSRIGGGSFSTVKRFLDIWKQRREDAAMAGQAAPAEVQAKAQQFACAVWALAEGMAQREALQVIDESRAEVALVRAEVAESNTEIARLEGIESEQASVIEQQQIRLREVELALADAQAQARRVAELEKTVTALRADLDAARKDVSEKAVEAGKAAGEAEALRLQVRELLATISPRTKRLEK